MSSWEDSFSEIRTDREHGATHIYRRALGIIKNIADENRIQSRADIGEINRTLHRAQPAMAPLHFLAEKLESISGETTPQLCGNLRELISSLERDSELAHSRIVTNFEKLNLNPKSIMLHSRSGTVVELVREVISAETRIFISEARPGMEGLNLAGELVIDGYTVKTFVDDARAEVMRDVDLIIIGSDWISEKDFTNKIGTLSLSLLAKQFGKKIYVAADATKFAHSRFRASDAQLRSPRESFYQDLLFEETPLELVTSFVTDRGIMSPSQVMSHFETN